ncbi:IucA/IucC family protein [Larsenimonas rhizosphaerae]|uniref:IucA/IucC family siderophore biosynthesis protein n=1 Tax=Larsenimonas rhizosphaerae TaxID=2944682 RepID=A0AA41ZHC0_9GAMM|nr:IucA/IucC family protein [Larsenimonas rhizosphaerae]MCX2524772.1 IucA/IucC family siderophore biosynthesis protein [Larsenimonas rhizosphaerae]
MMCMDQAVLPDVSTSDTPFLDQTAHWRHAARIERRVVAQLLQTLLYEQVLAYDVTERAGAHHFEVALAGGRVLTALGRVCQSFSLIRLEADSLRVESPAEPAVALTLPTLLSEVDALTGALAAQPGFVRELEQTLLHDLQSAAAYTPPVGPPTALGADALEQYFTDAHSYHPCYKSRIGFTLQDNARFGPEFGQPLQVVWLAIPASRAVVGHTDEVDLDALMAGQAGTAVMAERDAFCDRRGLRRDEVVLLPVHPWQWREQGLRALYPELARDEVACLGAGASWFVPQQSIRTLSPTTPTEPCLKLAMSLTNTSSTRLLARHTVTNAPRITAWLQTLVAQDEAARAMDFILLGEVAGVSLDERRVSTLRHDTVYGALGAIWRDNIATHLRSGEQAVPFNGLSQCGRSPDGIPAAPFIDPWIAQYGLMAWTRALIEAAAAPVLHLLFAEGIGLESHGQNIVIVHRDGWPVRAALKDFHDGVRFSPAHLAHPQQIPELEPVPARHAALNRNSFLITDDPAAVRDYSCDAFFFIALADMAIFLQRHYGLDEPRFWQMTAGVIMAYQQAHPQHRERFERFDVFNAGYDVEALTCRRLFGDDEPRIRHVPNPLTAFRPGEQRNAE